MNPVPAFFDAIVESSFLCSVVESRVSLVLRSIEINSNQRGTPRGAVFRPSSAPSILFLWVICERRWVGCEAARRRRCGTSSRSANEADGPPPQSAYRNKIQGALAFLLVFIAERERLGTRPRAKLAPAGPHGAIAAITLPAHSAALEPGNRVRGATRNAADIVFTRHLHTLAPSDYLLRNGRSV